jgi:hypothetical protein
LGKDSAKRLYAQEMRLKRCGKDSEAEPYAFAVKDLHFLFWSKRLAVEKSMTIKYGYKV